MRAGRVYAWHAWRAWRDGGGRTFGAPGRLIMRHESVTATTARDRAEYSACKENRRPLPCMRCSDTVALRLSAHRHIHSKQLHKP